MQCNLDLNVYGNSFSSMFLPFTRFLICEKCGAPTDIKIVKFRWVAFRFNYICSKCKQDTSADYRKGQVKTYLLNQRIISGLSAGIRKTFLLNITKLQQALFTLIGFQELPNIISKSVTQTYCLKFRFFLSRPIENKDLFVCRRVTCFT